MNHRHENSRLIRTQTIETLHKQTVWFSRELTGMKKRVLACIADEICPLCGNDLLVNKKVQGTSFYQCYVCDWQEPIDHDL